MKLPVFLLFFSLLARISIAQLPIPGYPQWQDLQSYTLKGNVQTLSQETTFPEGIPALLTAAVATQIPGIDSFSKIDIAFDSTGRVTEVIYAPQAFSDEKTPSSVHVVTSYKDHLPLYSVTKEDGKITDSIVFDHGRYDRLNSYQVYDHKAKLRYRYTYTYNSSRQLTTIRRRNEENYPVEMIKVKYDQAGNISSYQYYDHNMKQVGIASFNEVATDSTINGTILWTNDSARLTSGYMTVKNPQGLLMEENIIDKDRKVTGYNTYRYNQHSDIESARLFANMENIEVTYQYKYDDEGNWISRNIKINGLQGPLTLRKIVYYP